MPEAEVTLDELKDEVYKLMELDEDELYARLGYQSLGLDERATELHLFDSISITKSDLVISGKAYFERHKQQLKGKICDDWGYCKKRTEYSGDFKSLMGALILVVPPGMNLPAPLIAVLCVLAFKYGLDKLCGCEA
jgi:hypothetical protein